MLEAIAEDSGVPLWRALQSVLTIYVESHLKQREPVVYNRVRSLMDKAERSL